MTKRPAGPSAYEQDKLDLRLVPDEPTGEDLGKGMTPEEIEAFLSTPVEPEEIGNG